MLHDVRNLRGSSSGLYNRPLEAQALSYYWDDAGANEMSGKQNIQ